MQRFRLRRGLVGVLFAAAWALAQTAPQPARLPILPYIEQTWSVLTRSNRTLAAAAPDPKFETPAGGRWPVYISRGENLQRVREQLSREMGAADLQKIEVRMLPRNLSGLREHGLLYLPSPYVVPGGRFNEMYGWDSYFIQLGLLRDGKTDLAQDLVENFLYQIREYGKILNANRTYYLTRSQPPFLTRMLLGVYQQTHDAAWLAGALPAIEKYYRFWTTEPHLTPQTGLSRYYDLGDGPAPEALSAEKDAGGRTHYDRIREYFRTRGGEKASLPHGRGSASSGPDAGGSGARGAGRRGGARESAASGAVASGSGARASASSGPDQLGYNVADYYDAKQDRLTMLFYKGDRSMRESGFDPSDRFGKFNIDIIRYNPVCLNSLLYVMERDTAEILRTAGREADAATWDKRAAERASRMNRLMWDQQAGLYFDYRFVDRRMRHYPFLTTFFPLWAGIASPEQAAAVVRSLPLFEKPGGLQTSTNISGNQWDAPFAWAPLQLVAAEGLRRYGYAHEAERISLAFLSTVLEQYRQHGVIVEKYDAVRRSMDVSGAIQFGYSSNEVGFGWTNAAFTVLFDALPAERQKELLRP